MSDDLPLFRLWLWLTEETLLAQWGEYEQHISGDIVLAARQYWYATADKEWLTAIGFPLAKGVADFYKVRAAKRAYKVTTVGSVGGPHYDLNGMMGPDEFAYPVNNSAYCKLQSKCQLLFWNFRLKNAETMENYP